MLALCRRFGPVWIVDANLHKTSWLWCKKKKGGTPAHQVHLRWDASIRGEYQNQHIMTSIHLEGIHLRHPPGPSSPWHGDASRIRRPLRVPGFQLWSWISWSGAVHERETLSPKWYLVWCCIGTNMNQWNNINKYHTIMDSHASRYH